MYYWSTLVIRLGFGSFIVAILVGAYNKVVAQEQSEELEAAQEGRTGADSLPEMLPEGYVVVGTDDRESRWGRAKLAALLRYMITSNPRGCDAIAGRHAIRGGPGAGVLLVWALERVCTKYAKDDPVALTHEQLAMAIGEEASEKLLSGYGAAYDPEQAMALTTRRGSVSEVDDELEALVHLPDAIALPAPELTPRPVQAPTITPQTSAAEVLPNGAVVPVKAASSGDLKA